MRSIKVVIDHNNDTVTICPAGPDSLGPDSRACKFLRVKDTNMTEKILNEIFNMMGQDDSPLLNIELETINEDHKSSEYW